MARKSKIITGLKDAVRYARAHHHLLGEPMPVRREDGGVKLAYATDDILALQERIHSFFTTAKEGKRDGKAT